MPAAVRCVRQVVASALSNTAPRGELNLGMRRLKNRMETLRITRLWLDQPEVYVASHIAGCPSALTKWKKALEDMIAGDLPHVAFGMDKPGNRYNTNFTLHDELAIYLTDRVWRGDTIASVISDINSILGLEQVCVRSLDLARDQLGLRSADEMRSRARRKELKEPSDRLPEILAPAGHAAAVAAQRAHARDVAAWAEQARRKHRLP